MGIWLIDSCSVSKYFSLENPLDSAQLKPFRGKQNEVCEKGMWNKKLYSQLRLIPPHSVERFMSFSFEQAKRSGTQRCLSAVMSTLTNFSHYFHNGM